MIFYQRLRDVREDHDLSQTQIAEVLHTTQAQYSRWERLCGASSVALTQDYKPYMIGKK